MKQNVSVTFMIAILATMSVVAAIDTIPAAEAKKGQGVYNQKYGSSTSSIVCGDRLCSEADDSTESDHSEPRSIEKKSTSTKSSSKPMQIGQVTINSISGATVTDAKVDRSAGIVTVSIQSQDDGKIKLDIPASIKDAFMVIVDGEEWDDAYIDGEKVKVYFYAGAEQIEIIGNTMG